MHVYGELTGTLTSTQRITGNLASTGSIDGSLTVPQYVYPPAYTGEIEITPSPDEQVLETNTKYLTSNITVKPIPQNYGLITWDGSTLTVS